MIKHLYLTGIYKIQIRIDLTLPKNSLLGFIAG